MTTDANESAIASPLLSWLAEFSFPGAGSAVASRIQEVERWASVATIEEIDHLLALVFNLPKDAPPSSFMDKMRVEFRKTDPEFPAYGNDREMEVLAGMTMYSIMTTSRSNAALCALSIITASVCGTRALNLPCDLVAEATHVLERLSETGSQRPDLTRVALGKEMIAPPPALATLDLEVEAVRKCLSAIINSTQATLTKMAQRTDKALSDVDRFLRQQDEELQILWWLIGRRSHHFNRDMDRIPPSACPFVLAIDLAQYISILPGPSSISALVSRSGLSDNKPQALTALLSEVDAEFLQPMVVGMTISPVTHPLHFAIDRQLEQKTGDGWKQAWANRTKLPETLALTPHAFALQLYRERLLLKSVPA